MPTFVEVTCRQCIQPFQQALQERNRGIKYRSINPKSEYGLYCSQICVKKRYSIKYAANKETQCAVCKELMHVPPRKRRTSKTNIFTCSSRCKSKAMSVDLALIKCNVKPKKLIEGKRNYRRRAMAAHGAKCVICGYSKMRRMLDVDHIDGNRSNNLLGNLQVLCVWCHALKTRGINPHLWDGKL